MAGRRWPGDLAFDDAYLLFKVLEPGHQAALRGFLGAPHRRPADLNAAAARFNLWAHANGYVEPFAINREEVTIEEEERSFLAAAFSWSG